MGTFRTSRLERVMSVHWAKADIRLRASGSDFDARVRPVKAHGGGWSNLWRLSAPDRWASFTRKNSGLKKTKRPTSVVESYRTTYGHKVVVLMSVVEGRAENICSP